MPLPLYISQYYNASPGGSLNGLRWELPDLGPNPSLPDDGCITVPEAIVSTVMHGPAPMYIVKLRFRGVVELASYTGGSEGVISPDSMFLLGGTEIIAPPNVYRLDIGDDYYFLNNGVNFGVTSLALDETQKFMIAPGDAVTLTALSIDDLENNNQQNRDLHTPIVFPGLAPAPAAFFGQFVEMSVVEVVKGPSLPTDKTASLYFPFNENAEPWQSQGTDALAVASISGGNLPSASPFYRGVRHNTGAAGIISAPTSQGETAGPWYLEYWSFQTVITNNGLHLCKVYQAGNAWTAPYASIAVLNDLTNNKWIAVVTVGGVQTTISSPAIFPLNVWTKVGVSYDPGTGRLQTYLNGVPLVNANSGGGTTDWGGHGGWNFLSQPTGEPVDGIIAKFAFWHSIPSDADILAKYQFESLMLQPTGFSLVDNQNTPSMTAVGDTYTAGAAFTIDASVTILGLRFMYPGPTPLANTIRCSVWDLTAGTRLGFIDVHTSDKNIYIGNFANPIVLTDITHQYSISTYCDPAVSGRMRGSNTGQPAVPFKASQHVTLTNTYGASVAPGDTIPSVLNVGALAVMVDMVLDLQSS